MTEQVPSNSLLLQRLRTWALGEIGRQAADTIETLQRNLDLRNEQIDGYERQLGIIDQDAARTIGTEIERLQAREREAFRLANAATYLVPQKYSLHAELKAFMDGQVSKPEDYSAHEPPAEQIHRVCQFLREEVGPHVGVELNCEKCPLVEQTPYGQGTRMCVERAKELLAAASSSQPLLATGCHRSHPHEDMSAECERLTEIARENNRRANEPPAGCAQCSNVAPIAKLTVRDGLAVRAGLYAPGLPDGDHDVYPTASSQPPAPSRPSAWIRGVMHGGGPDGPTEYDEEVSPGEDQPNGEGWVALYTYPHPYRLLRAGQPPGEGPESLVHALEVLRQRWSHNVSFEATIGACKEEIELCIARATSTKGAK